MVEDIFTEIFLKRNRSLFLHLPAYGPDTSYVWGLFDLPDFLKVVDAGPDGDNYSIPTLENPYPPESSYYFELEATGMGSGTIRFIYYDLTNESIDFNNLDESQVELKFYIEVDDEEIDSEIDPLILFEEIRPFKVMALSLARAVKRKVNRLKTFWENLDEDL